MASAFSSLEIVLEVAENVDSFKTLGALICTCRAMHHLLDSYRTSVVKSWVKHNRKLVVPSGTALGSSFSDVKTSGGLGVGVGKVLEPFGFDVMREFDLRRRRIDALFEPGALLRHYVITHHRFRYLSDDQLERLIQGLKRACLIADRLRDCAAHAQRQHDQQVQLEESLLNPSRRAHWAMRRYIQQSISPNDLAYLSTLLYIIQPFLLRQPRSWSALGDVTDDDTAALAMQEVFLRNGTLALRAWFRPQGLGLVDGSIPSEVGGASTTSAGPPSPGLPEHDHYPSPPPSPSPTADVREDSGDAAPYSSQYTPPSPPPPSEPLSHRYPLMTTYDVELREFFDEQAKRVVFEIEEYEAGAAANVEGDREENDDGQGLLPGLGSTLHATLQERFLRPRGDKTNTRMASSGSGLDAGESLFSATNTSVRYLVEVVYVNVLTDVGYCRFPSH